MTRDPKSKYSIQRAQRVDGSWHSYRVLNHDVRYCGVCDSEDVERTNELMQMDGWYGGVRVRWGSAGSAHGIIVTDVLCRQHRQEHFDAEQSAPRDRRVYDENIGAMPAYWCPAHAEEHIDWQ